MMMLSRQVGKIILLAFVNTNNSMLLDVVYFDVLHFEVKQYREDDLINSFCSIKPIMVPNKYLDENNLSLFL